MKKVIVALAVAASLSAPLMLSPAVAGDTLFGSLGDLASKARNAVRSVIPTQVMALESDGGNFRYYEFTPPNNANIICWVAAGTQKGAGGCYPKGTPTKY